MVPFDILKKYYDENSGLYKILVEHCSAVAEKALSIANKHPELNLDKPFIYEASLLHDIGIFRTDAPEILCFGTYPYICHGYLGSEILMNENLPAHALVCERHTGTGLTLERILEKNYPVPHRDMQPVSMEEQLICFADKFFSKTKLGKEKSVDKIISGLEKYGADSVAKFRNWCKLFLG